ncbi:phage integrase [Betaproteobacteria bacterium]|nr:phage integrase [Betaproteobacteria bacterium]
MMKDKLITEVQASMALVLNGAQLEELRRVLTHCFHNVEFTERKAPDPQETAGNGDLLEVFIAAKRVEGCSEKSLKYYNATTRQMLGSVKKPIREITTDDLRVHLADYQRERGSSKVTIDNMRRIFSSFFGWLEDEDYILKSPVRRIHKIKADKTIKDTFSDEGLELLRDACEEVRDLAMIDLLASTGMRVGELVGLNREDINFHERECVVFGKGSTERVVYFDARTKIHLRNYFDSRSDQNPALFVSLALPHERLMIGGVETRLREIGQRADMQKVHPHKFRRTLATRAIDKGMPIEQVQRLLGHVKIDTTMHYAMVNQANVRNSHRKFIS